MPANNLARIEPQQPMWNDEDKALIRATVAKKATDAEFKLLLYTAAKYDLDPLIKQIWCVKYGDDPAAIYTSRDGFLHLAHKSGQFDGMETVAIRDNGKLVGARCTVWRKGYGRPFMVEVALSEYNTNKNQWSLRPETMIKKVAESQCLRRAFDISGLYEPGEMGADEENYVETTARPVPQEPTPLHPERSARLDVADAIKSETGLDTITDSTGTWAPLNEKVFNQALNKLIPAPDMKTAAVMLGISGFKDLVKTEHPDATTLERAYSAILHMVYTRREAAKEAEAIKQKASAVFEEGEVTELDDDGTPEF